MDDCKVDRIISAWTSMHTDERLKKQTILFRNMNIDKFNRLLQLLKRTRKGDITYGYVERLKNLIDRFLDRTSKTHCFTLEDSVSIIRLEKQWFEERDRLFPGYLDDQSIDYLPQAKASTPQQSNYSDRLLEIIADNNKSLEKSLAVVPPNICNNNNNAYLKVTNYINFDLKDA